MPSRHTPETIPLRMRGGRPPKEFYLTPRWDAMRPHAEQHRFWTSQSRFKVVPAGRRSGKCLAEGTLVTMADGTWRSIEKVVPGEHVLSLNLETYKLESKRVVAVLDNGVKETLKVNTRSRTLVCTPNHRLFVDNKWVEAEDVQVGQLIGVAKKIDNVVYSGMRWEEVRSIESGPVCRTYDLTVEGNHNFLAENAVVHNSELCKRKMVLRALDPYSTIHGLPLPAKGPYPKYFLGAPVWSQAKRIFWQDLKRLVPEWAFDPNPRQAVSETEMCIRLKSGAELWVIGMDKPERVEGSHWDGCVLDEYGNMRSRTWPEHVRPALADREGWCDFIGVPEGRNHYWNLAEMAKKVAQEAFFNNEIPEWDLFHWKSADILPASEIESARRDLDPLTFKQEFEACHSPDTLIRLWSGGTRRIADVVPGDILVTFQYGKRCPTTVLRSRSTGRKHMVTVELEDGTKIKASTCHKMKVDGRAVELADCDFLELVPDYFKPRTRAEALAAVVGFNLGDGTICDTGPTRNGQSYAAAFYSSDKQALEHVKTDLHLAGIHIEANVKEKGTGFWQLQIGGKHSRKLVRAGCVVGHKPSVDFGIPAWIKYAKSSSIKRAFLAGLFGAEGGTPRTDKKHRKQPKIGLAMHSKRLVRECGDLLEREFRVHSTYKGKHKVGYLYLDAKAFVGNVGYLYAPRKQELAWLWSRYIFATGYRVRKSHELYRKGYRWNAIADILNRNPIHRTNSGCVKNLVFESGRKWVQHSFPYFDDWVAERYKDGKLKLAVFNKTYGPTEECWNITVDSPDHSYILANEIDNFNSFIYFQGRVYYAFDRETHCRPLQYDSTQPLIFCFDFNISPGVAAVCQEQLLPGVFEDVYDDKRNTTYKAPVIGTGIIGEVFIPQNSNTVEVCKKLLEDWGEHRGPIYVYGDSTGGSGGSAKIAGSDWDLVKKMFRGKFPDLRYRIPADNPRIRVRVNAVNSRLLSTSGVIRLLVDKEKCPRIVNDFEGTRILEGSPDGTIDKKSDSMLTHLTDAIGYYICEKFPIQSLEGRSVELLW